MDGYVWLLLIAGGGLACVLFYLNNRDEVADDEDGTDW